MRVAGTEQSSGGASGHQGGVSEWPGGGMSAPIVAIRIEEGTRAATHQKWRGTSGGGWRTFCPGGIALRLNKLTTVPPPVIISVLQKPYVLPVPHQAARWCNQGLTAVRPPPHASSKTCTTILMSSNNV